MPAPSYADDLALVAAVSRTHAGRMLGDVLHEPRLTAGVFASAGEALATPCDVLVEYTKSASAKANILVALEQDAHVVVGTSGLTDDDFAEIDAAARRRQRRVLACGNFALTVVLRASASIRYSISSAVPKRAKQTKQEYVAAEVLRPSALPRLSIRRARSDARRSVFAHPVRRASAVKSHSRGAIT